MKHFFILFIISSFIAIGCKNNKGNLELNKADSIVTKSKQSVVNHDTTISKFVSGGIFGYKRGSNIIIKPQFDFANDFSEKKAFVIFEGKPYVINEQGKKLFEITVGEPAGMYSNNRLLVINKNGKIGFINETGKLIIPFHFDSGKMFSQNRAIVYINNKAGIIDIDENTISTFKYDDIGRFENSRAVVILNKKWGLIDINGKLLTKIEFDFIDTGFKAGHILVNKNKKFHYIDLFGRIPKMLQFNYENYFDEASTFSNEGIANVKIKNKVFCLNSDFSEIKCPTETFKMESRTTNEIVDEINKK